MCSIMRLFFLRKKTDYAKDGVAIPAASAALPAWRVAQRFHIVGETQPIH